MSFLERLAQLGLTILIVAAIVFALVWLAHRFAPPGWRTIVFNVASFVVGGIPAVIELLTGFDWRSLGFDTQAAAIAVMAVNVANIYWRSKTTAPLPKGDG